MKSQVVRVIEKTRLESDGNGNVFTETFKELDECPKAVSEEMADQIWMDHSIDVEKKGIKVKNPK